MLAHQLAPNVYARLCQTIRPMPKNILLENFQSQATSVRFWGQIGHRAGLSVCPLMTQSGLCLHLREKQTLTASHQCPKLLLII